jgi:TonB family protein
LLAERELVCDEDVIRYLGEPRVYAEGLWKVARFGLGWNLAGVSHAAGSNLTRRIELMLDVRRRTKLSLAGRAITASAIAALLTAAFTLAVFTRAKVEASKPPASQEGVPVPMQFENLPDIPLFVTELQASLGEARPVTFKGVAPDGQAVDLTRKDEFERDLNLTVGLLNQGDSAISVIAIQLQNPTYWGETGVMVNTGLGENESGAIVIEPQQMFTLRLRERVNERNNGVELMSSISDFRFKILGVMIEPNRSWIWTRNIRPRPTIITHPPLVEAIKKVDQMGAQEPAGGKPEGANNDADKIEKMSVNLRPTILYKEKAKYTDLARQNQIEGTVVLNVVFAADGRMTDFKVIRGLPDGLIDEAIKAAQVIRFEPAVKNGQRVSVRGNLEFSFNLDKSAGASTSNKSEPGNPAGAEQMTAFLRPTILYKEKAAYTEEARANEVQGTVILNVVFGADGTIGDIRVVRGLTNGLTDQAIKAAQAIRFSPATVDGKPVSVRGNLEFSFNLY